MKKYRIYIVWIMVASLCPISAYSQDSLSYYLEQAALNNPGVRAKYLEYSAALEKAPQAASLPDPELQFGYFIKPMELLGGNQVADIRFMQMFPWFGTLKEAKDEASKMALAKFESFRNARNELFFNIKASYYKVYLTKKEIEIAEKNLGILHTLEQLSLVTFSSGGISSSAGTGRSSATPSSVISAPGNNLNNPGTMGTGNMASSTGTPSMTTSGGSMGGSMSGNSENDMVNLLRVQIEIHSIVTRIELLKDQLITDKVSVNRYLNRPDTSEVFTSDSLSEVLVPENISSLADSLDNHPMVRMYEAEKEANDAQIGMVTRMGYPMIGLGINYSVINTRPESTSMMNGKDMIMPMATLTLPVYRKKYKAMRQEAVFMRDANSESAENIKNDLHVSLQQTIAGLNDAKRRITMFTEQAALADKSTQLLIASYSANGTDFEEVLRMEQQLLDFRLNQIEAIVDKNTFIAQLIYLTEN